MGQWRKWCSGASTVERTALLEIERYAKSYAVQEACWERLSRNPSLIADCSDIHVAGFRGRWQRKQGQLRVDLRVFIGPGRIHKRFLWNASVRESAGRAVPGRSS